MAGYGPVEPSADIRQMASALRQIYVGLTAEGFTERQALAVIGEIIRGGMKGES